MASLVLVAALLAAVLPALAQPGGGGHRGGRGMERGQTERPLQGREPMRDDRGDLRSDLRGENWRHDSAGGRCDGPCRMTPEERRQLRRDIDDAGRSLYGRGPRRGQN